MSKCVRSLCTRTHSHTDSLTFDQLSGHLKRIFLRLIRRTKEKVTLEKRINFWRKIKWRATTIRPIKWVLTVAAIKLKRKYFMVSLWIFDFDCVHFRGEIRWNNMNRFHGRVCAASDPSRSWSGIRNYFGWWQESEFTEMHYRNRCNVTLALRLSFLSSETNTHTHTHKLRLNYNHLTNLINDKLCTGVEYSHTFLPKRRMPNRYNVVRRQCSF